MPGRARIRRLDVEGAAVSLARIILLLALAFPVYAHIGSTTVFYEGDAGPYKLRVSIRPPDVVPGRAQINVRIHNGPVNQVSALPVRWDAGRKGAPPPDVAAPVAGEAGLYSTELWLMDFGAYSVFVDVEGEQGSGTAIVPLNSVSTQRLPMPRWMAGAFLAFGLILVVLLVAMIGAAVRESVLPGGLAAERARVRRGRIAMAGATVVLGLVLYQGKRWWDAVDADFRNNRLYQPVEVAARLDARAAGTYLTLNLEGTERDLRDHTPLVADHGKLMHLFLVREPDLSALAHLHPTQIAAKRFESALPRLPAGEYSVYADVTHESGLAQTLVSRIRIEAEPETPARADADDSAWVGEASSTPNASIGNGCAVRKLSPVTLPPGAESLLRFDVLAGDGKPAPLEPYMGMWSHAVVRAHDGSVYTHLHPSGTISLTAQELFARRERGEDLRKPIDVMCGRPERELVFPYSFPRAGIYRVWVQVKIAGEVRTAAFDVRVAQGS